MLENDVIRRTLERITAAFELQERGGTSLFALAVVVRAQAESLRAFRPDVAEPIAGLADGLDSAGKEARPAPIVRDLAMRFQAWRKDTLAVLDAESRPAKPKPAPVAATSPAPAPAAPAAPSAPPADEADAMSMEEIQKLLDGAKKP